MERLTNQIYNNLIKCQDCMENSNCYNHSCDNIDKAIRRLKYYEDAEENGLLKVLPCKVGDTLYLLDHECSEGMKYNCEIDGIMEGYLCRTCGKYPCTLHPSIQEVEVKNITIIKDTKILVEFTDLRDIMIEDFGVKVFITREEAEEKLKEMNNP